MKYFYSLAFLALTFSAIAQPGGSDPTFNPTDTGMGDKSMANGRVVTTLAMPGGALLVGGTFTTYQGIAAANIVKVKENGEVDQSFESSIYANLTGVSDMAIQADGKILIAGSFTIVDSVGRAFFTRLLPSGKLDKEFNAGKLGPDYTVDQVLALPTGKIMIAGSFSHYNGTPVKGIARLNADGSLDETFNPGTGFSSTSTLRITELASQGSKILVVGDFSNMEGSHRRE